MRTGRPKQPIILSKAEEEQLKSISRSRSFSHRLVTRVKKIDQFVEDYNTNTKPFVWTATADSIFEKIKRLCQDISETQH